MISYKGAIFLILGLHTLAVGVYDESTGLSKVQATNVRASQYQLDEDSLEATVEDYDMTDDMDAAKEEAQEFLKSQKKVANYNYM